jgi:acyl-coenzyme A synthetase/AMP-(fatty) acid ligase
MEMSPERPNLAVISLAHSYGFSNLVLPLLLHGIPMHALPVPFPQAVDAAFRAHRALNVPAVPSIWRAWFRSGVLDKAPVAGAFSAGAPLPVSLEQGVHEATGIKIRNFYGASECGGISLDGSERPRDDPADVGSALDGVGVSVDPGGRLLVESDAVGVGYDCRRPGDVLGDGRFLTHDLGRVDGRRVFLERSAGGAINVAGRKISPAKVEAALLATGIPLRVRVFGVASPDPDRVEEIVGMVALPAGARIRELKQAADGQLAGWEIPRHWWIDPPADAWSLPVEQLRRRQP